MVNVDVPIHQGDNIVLLDTFDFSQSIFDLEEPAFETSLDNDFYSTCQLINQKLSNFDKFFQIGHVNARSVPKHLHEIHRVLDGTGLAAMGTCETFITPDTPKAAFNIPGYNFFHVDRTMSSRGGVGAFVSSEYPARVIKLPVELVQPEMIFIEITVGVVKIAMGVIYKSPLIPYTVFAAIHENIAYISAKYEHMVILGDLNIDHLKMDSAQLKFLNTYLVEPFALKQLIDEPTRITKTSSTLIDLILASNSENVKTTGVIDTPGISDHCLIFMAYSLKKPKFKPKIITKRDFRKFDEIKFARDMEVAPWGNILAVADDDIDNKVTIFENIHRDIIDKHAPFRTFRVTRPASPWLNDKIKNLMDDRDKQKDKFNHDKKPETEEIYKTLRNSVCQEIRREKIKSFNQKINAKFKNPKQFHQALKSFSVVESGCSHENQCNIDPNLLNSSFVKNNNAKVNEDLVTDEVNEILKKSTRPSFSFVEVNEFQVTKMVKSIKTNACGVDSISAFFLKLGIEHSVYAFTNIINTSILYKKFPTRWKYAIVKPLPKNNNPADAADFRPISLLPAFSKVVEKLMAKQMIEYLKETNYFDGLQSAYKPGHSTITALLNVTDDIYECLENSELVFLVLLDYSKAFDCANHRLILAKLKAAGFRDDALTWVSSYLSDRKQKVCTNNGESGWSSVSNGVPQGSVLGPLLFTVLVSDLRDAIKRGRYHMYADDTQLYYSCKCENANETIENINSDLERISKYSKTNCLKLNAGKSKYIIIGSRHNLKKLKDVQLEPIKIDSKIIEREYEAKNLGVTFDEELTWIRHVNLSVAKAYGKLKHAYRFKNFLNEASKQRLTEAYILSQFNYGDIILQNLTEQLQNKIQKVQNRCVRYTYGLRKYDHISGFIKNKNILNMKNRRMLHNLSLMFKIQNNKAPKYLRDRILMHRDVHSHFTRNRLNIDPPFARSKVRSMSFFIYISKKYNLLSQNINTNNISLFTFKINCKKYLLNQQ